MLSAIEANLGEVEFGVEILAESDECATIKKILQDMFKP